MTFKKVLPFILIIVVIAGILFGPFSARAKTVRAQTAAESGGWSPEEIPGTATPVTTQNYQDVNGDCNPFYFNAGNCVLIIGANIAQYAIWMPANLFLAIGGAAMDTSIGLTINGSIFSGLANDQNGAVTAGWGLSRDIINIFLIFILLYIAIATILQISGYGAKELLATLIVIAFLVNFSLVITKLIVDASNVLAVGFYNAFPQENSQIQISQSFKQAFDLDKIVTEVKAADTLQNSNIRNLYIIKLLTFLLGAGIAAIAGFIFIVFAALFVIRMVSLLILMILAPLAFGAMILPSTKSYSSKWWSTLFSQAFFAPAGLFMLWLAAKMSSSMHSVLQSSLGVGNKGLTDMLADAQNNTNWENIVKFILQFVIIAIILILAIVISKQMGAMGAESTIKGLKKAGRKAQGYAGRIGRYGGARLGGPIAESVLKGEGKAAAFVRSIPLATRGLAGVSALEEKRRKAETKEYKEYKEAYKTYSDAGLQAMLKTPIITERKRKAINEIIEERKKAKMPKNAIDQLKEALKTELKEEMEAEKSTTPKTP